MTGKTSDTKQVVYPWGHSRRFNSYPQYFKKHFGSRVQKVSVDAGFTCPNIDGTVARGGCTYCNNKSFNPSYLSRKNSIKHQIGEGIRFHEKRYHDPGKYLAYFQAYSNTYADLKQLQKLYAEALEVPGIIGLVIGTRPDCLDKEKLKYLQELSNEYHVVLEIGIESVYDRTLERINRGHSFSQAVDAIGMSAEHGLKTGTHLIFGLPGETREDMLAEASVLSGLPLNNIKLHQLQLIQGTPMVKEYKEKPEDFQVFGMDEYLDFLARFIEKLNPAFVIERFFNEAPPRYNKNPVKWGLRYDQILNRFEKLLQEQDTWQGKDF